MKDNNFSWTPLIGGVHSAFSCAGACWRVEISALHLLRWPAAAWRL